MFANVKKRKVFLSVVSIVLLLALLLFGTLATLFADSMQVFAASATPAALGAVENSVSISSSVSSSEPVQNSGDLQVVSYSTHIGGQAVTSITPGMIFSMHVRLHDSRITPQTNPLNFDVLPKAVSNSTAFTPRDVGAVSSGFDVTYSTNPAGGIDYNLEFVVRYNGAGDTFQADVFYEGPLGDIAPMKSITIQLNNTVPTSSSSSSDPISSSSEVVRGTGFALKDASYGDETVYAGDNFTLQLTMLSTNGANNIENVSATIVPDQNFTLSSGASTIYFGTASPNQNIPLEFQLNAAANAEDGSYKVTVNVTGVSALTGESVTTAVDISIPVQQPDRFVVNNFAPIDYITAGPGDGSGYMSLELINMGKSTVSNVIVSVESEGVYAEEGQVYVGNFVAGAKNSVDLTMLADEAGVFDVTVVISYETARGEVKEIREPFQLEVGEAMMDMDFSFSMPIEEESGPAAWPILIVVVLLVAGGLAAVLIIRKRHKAKKDAELEDDDDEDL